MCVLADSLVLSGVAEGLETEAQRDFPTNLVCDYFQGYLLSWPLPIKKFREFAAKVLQVSIFRSSTQGFYKSPCPL